MPKVIDDAKKLIVQVATEELFNEGYNKLTIRNVAKKCNIGIGTIYNYFSSKDMLIASIIAFDWKKVLDEMDTNINQSKSFEEGIKSIYLGIITFANAYNNIWDQYNFSISTRKVFKERHILLRNQIIQKLEQVFELNNIEYKKEDLKMIGEIIILPSVHDDITYKNIMDMIQNIFIKRGLK